MLALMRPAAAVLVGLTLATGVVYPLAITVVGQAAFPRQTGGSLIWPPAATSSEANSRDWASGGEDHRSPAPALGSELIGQSFSSDRYFWSRPSATGPVAYNAAASSGSNLGPTNPAQWDLVRSRVARLRQTSGDERSPVPIDLVTASASGLDPHISPAAAEYQAPRIARARGIGEYDVRRLISEHVEGRQLGILGEPRVNVLKLNLALDKTKATKNDAQSTKRRPRTE